MSFVRDNPNVFKDPEISLDNLADFLASKDADYQPEEQETSKFLVFFYVEQGDGKIVECQSTVLAFSHDEAIEKWCAENREGEHPEAVRIDDCERNY